MEKLSKKDLRKQVRAAKARYTAEELVGQSDPLIRQVLAHPQLQTAQTVLLYNSMADEVATHNLISHLALMGKTVLLPVVISETEMEIRHYTGPDSLRISSYGILEPTGEPFTQYENIDFALIPGMAFDADGNRLGRGKGYYDRFLPLMTRARKVGICFPFQFLPHIPTEPTDMPMDEVIH